MSKEHGLDWPKWRKSVNDSRSQKVLRLKQERDELLGVLKEISENLALGPLDWAAKYGPDSDQHAILTSEVTDARELIERIDRE